LAQNKRSEPGSEFTKGSRRQKTPTHLINRFFFSSCEVLQTTEFANLFDRSEI
jgi:hypothetical protein